MNTYGDKAKRNQEVFKLKDMNPLCGNLNEAIEEQVLDWKPKDHGGLVAQSEYGG